MREARFAVQRFYEITSAWRVAESLLSAFSFMAPPPSAALEALPSVFNRGRTQRVAAAATGKAASSSSSRAVGPAPAERPQLLYAVASAPGHSLPGHVEQPARVEGIMQQLKIAGITASAFEGQVRRAGHDEATAPAPGEPQHRLAVAASCKRACCPCLASLQLHQVPVSAPAPLDAVRAVHGYVDELQRVAAEEAPKAVADVGDPGGRRKPCSCPAVRAGEAG